MRPELLFMFIIVGIIIYPAVIAWTRKCTRGYNATELYFSIIVTLMLTAVLLDAIPRLGEIWQIARHGP